MNLIRSVPAWLGFSLLLGWLTLACGSAQTPAPPTPVTADAFAVVRATSQAAFQTGQAYLATNDIVRGCPAIDTAKTNDPDNDPAIQRALEQCLTAIALAVVTPTAEATAVQRTIVVATVPAASGPGVAATPAPTVVGLGGGLPAAPGTPRPGSTPVATGAANMVMWRDPQGRFTVSAPAEWQTVDQPLPLFGNGVVQFRDPTGRAELDVAVDSSFKAVSPELYAASMDIGMQQQVAGYAAEQVQPGSAAGQPSIKRVFTFTQHDAAGRDLQARSFQVVVLKGASPYIISGSAPAEQFEQYSPTFDRMVESFRFS